MTYYKNPDFDWKKAKEALEPRYRTIYADPPWFLKGMYGEMMKKYFTKRGYEPMTLKQLKQIPVQDLIHPDGAHLYLWSSNPLLPDSLELMKAWGFQYLTAITWLKEGPANGKYFRSMTEQCLFGTRSARGKETNLPLKEVDKVIQRGETAFYSPREADLRKPDKMRRMIETVSHGPFVEIFPREAMEGWDAWDGKNNVIRRPYDLNRQTKAAMGRPPIVRE